MRFDEIGQIRHWISSTKTAAHTETRSHLNHIIPVHISVRLCHCIPRRAECASTAKAAQPLSASLNKAQNNGKVNAIFCAPTKHNALRTPTKFQLNRMRNARTAWPAHSHIEFLCAGLCAQYRSSNHPRHPQLFWVRKSSVLRYQG